MVNYKQPIVYFWAMCICASNPPSGLSVLVEGYALVQLPAVLITTTSNTKQMGHLGSSMVLGVKPDSAIVLVKLYLGTSLAGTNLLLGIYAGCPMQASQKK